MATYLKKGYSKNWINQRLKSIEVRKELTDEWEDRGVKEGLKPCLIHLLEKPFGMPYGIGKY